MDDPSPNVYSATCPSRQALDLVADKWAVLIIGLLAKQPHRFGQLRRAIDGISQKMLTQTLRNLERDGLVARRAFASVPVTVEYSLTPLGETLTVPLSLLCQWAEQHIKQVQAARLARASLSVASTASESASLSNPPQGVLHDPGQPAGERFAGHVDQRLRSTRRTR
jgi:DNA-binding HxlR family transcriptional regulator